MYNLLGEPGLIFAAVPFDSDLRPGDQAAD